MDVFNNREIAIGFWIAVVFAAAMASPNLRKAGYDVLRAFAHRLILIPLCLMAIYIVLIVYGLDAAGLWDVSQLKNTLLWSVSVAAVGLFRINAITNDPHYFRHALRDNFKMIAVLEFIIAFYTFSLWAELIIIPVMTFIVLIHAYAEEKQVYALVARVFDNILAAAGIGLLIFAIYRIVTDLDSFMRMQTLSDFLLPPVLSLIYLPFLYVIVLYATYESVFTRLHFSIKDEALRSYARRAAVAGFHVRTSLLKRWARNIMAMNPASRAQIAEAIREVKTLRKREQNPDDVLYERGWSPYAATCFLQEEGFQTDDYHCTLYGTGEWHAASPPMKLGRAILGSTITYYVEGDEFTATQLKLALNVDEPKESQEAHDKFVASAWLLCEKALNSAMPPEVEQLLRAGKDREAFLCGKKIVVSKEAWPGHRLNGYTMKFIIRNEEHRASG